MRKNYFYNSVLTIFNLLVPILIFPHVARILGPAGVGKAQFVFLLCQYVALLAGLGVPTYGVREVARVADQPEKLNRLVRELLLINLIIGAGLALAFVVAVLYVPFFKANRSLYLMGSLLILLSFTNVEWLYSGLGKFKSMALRSVAVKSATLIATYVAVRERDDAPLYFVIMVGGVGLYNGMNMLAARQYYTGGGGALQPSLHYRPMVFLFGTVVASTLYTTFDSVLLGLLTGDAAVGLYTAATKIAKITLPVVMAYGAVLLPIITQSYEQHSAADLKALLDRSYSYIIGLGIPAFVGLLVFAPGLVRLFSGEEFSSAVLTLRILAAMPLVVGLGYFWGYQIMLPAGYARSLFGSAAVGMAVSLGVNFLLVRRYAHNGAAIASLAAEVAVGISYFVSVRKRVSFRPAYGPVLWATLCSLPFVFFLRLPLNYVSGSQPATLLCNVGICAALYAVLQIFVAKNRFLRAALSPVVPQFRRTP